MVLVCMACAPSASRGPTLRVAAKGGLEFAWGGPRSNLESTAVGFADWLGLGVTLFAFYLPGRRYLCSPRRSLPLEVTLLLSKRTLTPSRTQFNISHTRGREMMPEAQNCSAKQTLGMIHVGCRIMTGINRRCPLGS